MTQPKWFKPASIFILIWMSLGVCMLVLDLMSTPEQIAALPEPQRLMYETRPTWLMGVFGIATGTGLIGAIALVMKKASAVTLLTISLVAVVAQFGYTIVGMKALEVVGPAHALGMPGFIFLMGAFSLWVAIKGRNEHWLS
jgi:hypothetical protein